MAVGAPGLSLDLQCGILGQAVSGGDGETKMNGVYVYASQLADLKPHGFNAGNGCQGVVDFVFQYADEVHTNIKFMHI